MVSGDKGTGKSNIAMVMCEIALKKVPELEVLSNIKLKTPFPRYHHFVNESDFLWYLTRIKRPMVIFDEAGIYASTGAGDSGESRRRRGQLEGFLKLMRKFDINMIWIDQVYDGSVPPSVKDMTRYNIETPYLGSKDFFVVKGRNVRDLIGRYPNHRLTTIPYHDKGISSFRMDLPEKLTMLDMFEYLSNTPPDHFRDKLQEWLMCHPTFRSFTFAKNRI